MANILEKAVKRRVSFESLSESPVRCERVLRKKLNMVLELTVRYGRAVRVSPVIAIRVVFLL